MTAESDSQGCGAALAEGAAVEVIAYLVTAARTQLDEAAEYAPMRLLTGARRIAEHLEPHASDPVRDLINALEALSPIATPRDNRVAYTQQLDAVCVAVADCLLALSDPPTS